MWRINCLGTQVDTGVDIKVTEALLIVAQHTLSNLTIIPPICEYSLDVATVCTL